MRDVRVLSIKQPWAWAIVAGLKPVENRPRAPSYRGLVLLHASKRLERAEIERAEAVMARIPGCPPLPSREELEAQCGGIVGVGTLVRCVTMHSSPWFFGPHGLLFSDVRPLPFTPCKGQLGLFRPPPEAAKLVEMVR